MKKKPNFLQIEFQFVTSPVSNKTRGILVIKKKPTPEIRQAWLEYRQALRDLPTVTEDPANPVWPVAPTA
jgi:hypothetical protein